MAGGSIAVTATAEDHLTSSGAADVGRSHISGVHKVVAGSPRRTARSRCCGKSTGRDKHAYTSANNDRDPQSTNHYPTPLNYMTTGSFRPAATPPESYKQTARKGTRRGYRARHNEDDYTPLL